MMSRRPRCRRAPSTAAYVAGLLLLAGLAACDGGPDPAAGPPADVPGPSSDGVLTVPEWDEADGGEPVPFNSDAAPSWSGPVRDERLPVLPRRRARGWTDPSDVTYAGIDLRRVSGHGREYNGVAVIDGENILSFRAGGWQLGVAARPPRSTTVDPTRRVIEYGVVVDADGDRDPDCHIGINNDARQRRGGRQDPIPVYRVWVTNLRTGATDERVGPPYGFPVEFIHPGDRGARRAMGFGFLSERPAACDRFAPTAAFYGYATLTRGRKVVAWDVAPDHAWLPMQCSRACREAR